MIRYSILAAILSCGPTLKIEAGPQLTVMSLNIASGAGGNWNTLDSRHRQFDFVRKYGVDVLGMQEVDLHVRRSGKGVNTGAAVGLDLIDPPKTNSFYNDTFVYNTESGTVVFGTSFIFTNTRCDILDGGTCDLNDARYGNAIYLSNRITIESAYTMILPETLGANTCHNLLNVNAFINKDYLSATEEPRSVLIVRARTANGTRFAVLSTHLSAYAADNVSVHTSQLGCINQVIEHESNVPVILVGDFNSLPEFVGDQLDTFTSFVGKDIDQIWAKGIHFVPEDSYGLVPTEGNSDHLFAPLARFKL